MRSWSLAVVMLVQVVALNSFMANAATNGTIDLSTAILLTVDKSGKGDFKTIQEAIDSVPSKNSELVFIRVKPGIYREKVVVPVDKPFVTLSGAKASNTIITSSQGGDIFESPTLSVFASDFVARFLTIENTFGSSDKAVALRVSGDRAAFYGCRITSYQDTLLDDEGSHYYSDCYIEGATDFICGNGAALFERCHIHSVSRNYGSITAQHRETPTDKTGYTFLGCKITGTAKGTAFLGRPWGAYSRVVFAFTYMSSSIVPSGWDDWLGDLTKRSTVFYAEYKSYGAGAVRAKRVEWSQNLNSTEAAPFLTKDIIGGRTWLRSSPSFFKIGSTIIKARGSH